MVDIADIKDKDSLKAWLEDQPRWVSVWIASRAAARVLPLWWQSVLTKDWARERDLTALPVLRSVLISTVAAFVPRGRQKSDEAAADAYASADKAHEGGRGALFAYADTSEVALDGDAGGSFTEAARLVARAAAQAADTADATEDEAARSAAHAADAAARAAADTATFLAGDATAWRATRFDAEQASKGRLPNALPLWPERGVCFENNCAEIKAQVAASPDAADWQFWLDWYDAQLAGRTMLPDPARTWDMLEKIALIDPETWGAGPEVVNPKIREIWELYRLRVEVAALQAEKEAFLAARASHAQRNHNQPPEGLVDDQPELARQITIVWDSLDEARDELEQDAPDKGWLRAIAEKLLSALTAVAKYCAKVADTAVISAAKVGGGAVGTAILDHVANNGRLMQFAKDLLTYGGG